MSTPSFVSTTPLLLRPVLTALCLLAAMPTYAQASAFGASTVSTLPDMNASVGNFGAGATATFGQTITAPAQDSLLTRFAFVLENFGGAPLEADAEVYAWDGAGVLGPALFQSAPFTIAANSAADPLAGVLYRATPNITLSAGGQYVLLFTTSGLQSSQSAAAQFGAVTPATYTDGSLVTLESGNDHSALSGSSDYFVNPSYDLAFQADFAPLPEANPVPEASTTVSLGLLLMLGAGGTVAARRKKRTT